MHKSTQLADGRTRFQTPLETTAHVQVAQEKTSPHRYLPRPKGGSAETQRNSDRGGLPVAYLWKL